MEGISMDFLLGIAFGLFMAFGCWLIGWLTG